MAGAATSIIFCRDKHTFVATNTTFEGGGKVGGEKTGGGGSILRLVGVHTMSGGDGEVGTDEDGATYVTEGGRGKAGLSLIHI